MLHVFRLNDEHFVHIVDPNRPWDLQRYEGISILLLGVGNHVLENFANYDYLVNYNSIKTDHAEVISHLKWSPSASHFLTVDCTGVFKLWGMKVVVSSLCFSSSWSRVMNKQT